VLNGVGGRTVEEAKERMSYAEALQWRQYLERRGTTHLGMRLEAGFALLASSINRALGGKASIEDFMPHADPPDSLAQVMNILSGKG
jgi:hypothetical protein